MTGTQFLDMICGKEDETRPGILDHNPKDADYRRFILELLNLTIKDIENMQDTWHWRWLEVSSSFPTVVDQMSYDLPGTAGDAPAISVYKMIDVREKTYDTNIRYVPQEVFDRFIPDPDTGAGTPKYYTLYADAIKLWPIPNEVMTIYLRYVRRITALADDSNSCEVPTNYDNIILDGTLVKAYQFDGRVQDAASAQQMYIDGIDRMKTDNIMIPDNVPVAGSHRRPKRRVPWQSPVPE